MILKTFLLNYNIGIYYYFNCYEEERVIVDLFNTTDYSLVCLVSPHIS